MSRDYIDLSNDKIAVYNFRGYTVLRFYKETKTLEIGEDANMCSFINDDLKQMSQFLANCWAFAEGHTNQLDNMEVD